MSIRSLSFRLAGLFLALSLMPGRPQAAPPAAAAPSPPPSDAQAVEESRRLVQLGPGDSVTISVFGQPDMATTTYIGDDGTLSVPLAGVINVQGMSPAEAARRVEKELRAKKILVDPHVTLSAIVSRSQRVSVVGEVGRPERYVIESHIAILDLLAQAGGVTENAADTIYVLHPDKDGSVVRREVSLKGLSKGSLAAGAQTLQAGDTLFVPRAEQFYIYGEVSASGKFRIEPGMTVIQAIARAGGITVRGSQRRVEIKRLQPDGTFKTFKAKLDEAVHGDDVIRVKESIF